MLRLHALALLDVVPAEGRDGIGAAEEEKQHDGPKQLALGRVGTVECLDEADGV